MEGIVGRDGDGETLVVTHIRWQELIQRSSTFYELLLNFLKTGPYICGRYSQVVMIRRWSFALVDMYLHKICTIS